MTHDDDWVIVPLIREHNATKTGVRVVHQFRRVHVPMYAHAYRCMKLRTRFDDTWMITVRKMRGMILTMPVCSLRIDL